MVVCAHSPLPNVVWSRFILYWLRVGISLLLVHASNEGWRGSLQPLDISLVPFSASLARTRLVALHHRLEPLQHARVLKPQRPAVFVTPGSPPVIRLVLGELPSSPSRAVS